MRFHSLWKVLMTGMGCGLLAAACSAPDPGAYTLSDKTPHVGSATTSGGTSGTSGGSSGTSGTTDAGTDAGRDSAPPPLLPDAFKGAPAYVATDGQSTVNANHATADNNPPSKDCFSCHGGGGAGNEFV